MKAFSFSHGARRRECKRNASVLIVILWISFGLVSIAVLFGHSMMLNYRARDNELAARQAEQAIVGALRYAQYLFTNLDQPGQLPLAGTYEAEYIPIGEATCWFLGRDLGYGNIDRPYFGFTDEAGKLNLNKATRAMLEMLPRMTVELAAAIVDWRDEDEELTEGGAETESYAMRQPGYECKNAPFETVEELNLVIGATVEILYGEDVNRNGFLDPNEDDGDTSWPPDDSDGILDPGIVEYLTVYTHGSTSGSSGSDQVDVNGQREQLAELLEETFGEDRANQIMGALNGVDQFDSLIRFFVRSGMTESEFGQVSGRLTASNTGATNPVVNVNTASEVVLACLPGMDPEKAAQLVAYRQGLAESTADVTWVVSALGQEEALAVGPYLTGTTSQVSVDIAAVGRQGRGYRRSLFVMDLDGSEPVIRYRKDLSRLGWALGTEVFEEMAMLNERDRR